MNFLQNINPLQQDLILGYYFPANMDFLFSYMYVIAGNVASQLLPPLCVNSKLGTKICAIKLLELCAEPDLGLLQLQL